MKVEIKSRFTGKIIVSGDYLSIKDCLEKNRGAYLRGADLGGADLGGADLGGAYLRGAYLRGADLRGADLRDADLRGADLGDADLRGADLRGADLRGAYLGGIKNYVNSHDIFVEVVKRQKVEIFLDAEWVAIAQITIHSLCWDSIRKRFSDVMPGIFKKLADAGFDEWLEYWNK